MGDRPPFDAIRACFYLIAAILGFQCMVAAAGVFICIYWAEAIIAGKFSCDNVSQTLNQLLTGALSAALAFAAGFTRKDK